MYKQKKQRGCKPLIRVRDEKGNKIKFSRKYDSFLYPKNWGEQGKGEDAAKKLAIMICDLLVELQYEVLRKYDYEKQTTFIKRANSFLELVKDDVAYFVNIEDEGPIEPLKREKYFDLGIHMHFSNEDDFRLWGEKGIGDEEAIRIANTVKRTLKSIEYSLLSVQGKEKFIDFKDRVNEFDKKIYNSSFITVYQLFGRHDEDIENVVWGPPIDDGSYSCENDVDIEDEDWAPPCCLHCEEPINKDVDWASDDYDPQMNFYYQNPENLLNVWHPRPNGPVDKVENLLKLRELAKRVYCAIVEYNDGGKFMFSLSDGQIMLPLKVKNIKGTKLNLMTIPTAYSVHPLDILTLLNMLMDDLRDAAIGADPYMNLESAANELIEVNLFLENLENAAIRYCKDNKIDSSGFDVLPGLWDNLAPIEDYIVVG